MNNEQRLEEIYDIIEEVDRRCLSLAQPYGCQVGTTDEMTQSEIFRIYGLAKNRVTEFEFIPDDEYVVGFAYTEDRKEVLLVKKKRPEWQVGSLNGIVGKIEEGETPTQAMHREGIEEAGLNLPWSHMATMKGTNNDGRKFICHVLYSITDKVREFSQIEDEELCLCPVKDLSYYKRISNLDFLIPFGICKDHSIFLKIQY